jgi:hypothetical protein
VAVYWRWTESFATLGGDGAAVGERYPATVFGGPQFVPTPLDPLLSPYAMRCGPGDALANPLMTNQVLTRIMPEVDRFHGFSCSLWVCPDPWPGGTATDWYELGWAEDARFTTVGDVTTAEEGSRSTVCTLRVYGDGSVAVARAGVDLTRSAPGQLPLTAEAGAGRFWYAVTWYIRLPNAAPATFGTVLVQISSETVCAEGLDWDVDADTTAISSVRFGMCAASGTTPAGLLLASVALGVPPFAHIVTQLRPVSLVGTLYPVAEGYSEWDGSLGAYTLTESTPEPYNDTDTARQAVLYPEPPTPSWPMPPGSGTIQGVVPTAVANKGPSASENFVIPWLDHTIGFGGDPQDPPASIEVNERLLRDAFDTYTTSWEYHPYLSTIYVSAIWTPALVAQTPFGVAGAPWPSGIAFGIPDYQPPTFSIALKTQFLDFCIALRGTPIPLRRPGRVWAALL